MEFSPQSPEARRKRLARMEAAFGHEVVEKTLKRGTYPLEVLNVSRSACTTTVSFTPAICLSRAARAVPVLHLAAAMPTSSGRPKRRADRCDAPSQLRPDVAALSAFRSAKCDRAHRPVAWPGAAFRRVDRRELHRYIRDILRRAYGVPFFPSVWDTAGLLALSLLPCCC